eukprot:1341762-Rhodomonas_salina.3
METEHTGYLGVGVDGEEAKGNGTGNREGAAACRAELEHQSIVAKHVSTTRHITVRVVPTRGSIGEHQHSLRRQHDGEP